ncbi:unnamed protein product [Durusdinium trenchii]|uniref:PRA1 family protein n=1 Tax=Durusdinium trenchii TaxID=1381693 RepID=A0ABP0T1T4_9DINO
MQQLTSRPLTEVVAENGRALMQVPRYLARAYSSAARRYLRPWNEFARLNPQRVVEGVRQASRRGEIQVYLQRNVIANARHFCPNYAFIFLAMLFMFVCTSPMLLMMLAGVGGGWSHAMRSDQFRNRPWTLQIGESVPSRFCRWHSQHMADQFADWTKVKVRAFRVGWILSWLDG